MNRVEWVSRFLAKEVRGMDAEDDDDPEFLITENVSSSRAKAMEGDGIPAIGPRDWLNGYPEIVTRGMDEEGNIPLVHIAKNVSCSRRAKAKHLSSGKSDAKSLLDNMMKGEEDLNSSRGRRRRRRRKGGLGFRVFPGRGGFIKFKHMILARNHARKRNKDALRKGKHAVKIQ